MNTPTNESNTTFVQVDPSTFRAIVQKLTGAGASTDPLAQKLRFTLSSRTTIEKIPKRAGLKLTERRRTIKKLELNLKTTETTSPSRAIRGLEIFGSERIMASSPVSTLEFLPLWSPEKDMAEKGFYLPPSPHPPELLPLFPLHSPLENNNNVSSSSCFSS